MSSSETPHCGWCPCRAAVLSSVGTTWLSLTPAPWQAPRHSSPVDPAVIWLSKATLLPCSHVLCSCLRTLGQLGPHLRLPSVPLALTCCLVHGRCTINTLKQNKMLTHIQRTFAVLYCQSSTTQNTCPGKKELLPLPAPSPSALLCLCSLRSIWGSLRWH